MSRDAERLYDRLLILRCQAGDADAFREIVERFGPRLRYYLRKLLGRAEDADDALQEVWFDLYRAVPRLNDPGAFSAWAYRIARDRAFRQLRRPRRREVALPEDLFTELDNATDPFDAEDAERVHAALDRLSTEHREVLVLRFLEDMPYNDIARVTGNPVGTVRSRLHHAKIHLRQLLEKDPRHGRT